MHKKAKALISGILASVLIESMVFTSVAAPILDTNTIIESNYGVDTEENDANIEEIEDSIDDETSTFEEDDNDDKEIEESKENIDDKENDDTIKDNEIDTEDNENTLETDESKIDIMEDAENESEEIADEDDTEDDEIFIDEELENDLTEIDDEKKELEIKPDEDLIKEDIPFRITPRQSVDENNLSTALSDLVLYTYDNEEVEVGGNLINDKYYYIDLTFEEDADNQFNGIDTYKLPHGFTAYGKDVSGSFECIDYGTDEVFNGKYTINSSGLIKFEFPKVYDGGYFPEYFENTILEARIKVKVNIEEGFIEFDNGYIYNIYKDKLALGIDKVVPEYKELDDNTIELKYNIKPEVLDGTATECIIRDELEEIEDSTVNSIYYNKDSFIVRYYEEDDYNGVDWTEGIDYNLDINDNTFEIEFIDKELTSKDYLYIEYRVIVETNSENYDFNVNNKAEFISRDKEVISSTSTRLKKGNKPIESDAITKKVVDIKTENSLDGSIRKRIRYSVDIDTSKFISGSGETVNVLSYPVITDNIDYTMTGYKDESIRLDEYDNFILEVDGQRIRLDKALEIGENGRLFSLSLEECYNYYLMNSSNIHLEYSVIVSVFRDYTANSDLSEYEFNLNNELTISGDAFTNNGNEYMKVAGSTDVLVDSFKEYVEEEFSVDVSGDLDKEKGIVKWTMETNESPLGGLVVKAKISDNQEFIKDYGIDLELTNNKSNVFFDENLTQDKLHIDQESISYENNEIKFEIPKLYSEKAMGEGCENNFDTHIVGTYYTKIINDITSNGDRIADSEVVIDSCDNGCTISGSAKIDLERDEINLSKYSDTVSTAYVGEHIGYVIKLQADSLNHFGDKQYNLVDELPFGLNLVENSIDISDSSITYRIDGNKLIFENINFINTDDIIIIKYDTIVNDKIDSYNIKLSNTATLYDKVGSELNKVVADINVSKDIESSAIAGGSGYVTTDFNAKVEVIGDYTIKGEEFSFEIIPETTNPKNDPIIGGVILNDTNGLIDLFKNDLKYTGPGEYVYKINQIDDTKIDRMIYDESVFEVKVKVEYIEKKLVAIVEISKDTNIENEIIFVNEFRKNEEPSKPEEKPSEPEEKPSEPEEKPNEPSKPEEKPDEPSKPNEPEEKPSEPEIKPDTKPSGNNSGSSDSSYRDSNISSNTTTINDNITPLANMPNSIHSINGSEVSQQILHTKIEEMLIPLSDLPDEKLDSLPKTDDINNLVIYQILAILSLVGICIVYKDKH